MIVWHARKQRAQHLDKIHTFSSSVVTETCLCKRVAPVPHVYFHAVRFLSPWALRPCSLRQPCCSYSIPPGCKQAFHHVVRPPGGVVAKQSSALCFWLVDISHKCLDLCLFAHRTASFKRLMNSSLPSSLVGIVWSRRCFSVNHAFSIALKSWEYFGYGSTSLRVVFFKACKARGFHFFLLGNSPKQVLP